MNVETGKTVVGLERWVGIEHYSIVVATMRLLYFEICKRRF